MLEPSSHQLLLLPLRWALGGLRVRSAGDWPQIAEVLIKGMISMSLDSGTVPYKPAKSLQLCPILWNPMDCSPPGSSVQRTLQARVLQWVAMPSLQGISWKEKALNSLTWHIWVSLINRNLLMFRLSGLCCQTAYRPWLLPYLFGAILGLIQKVHRIKPNSWPLLGYSFFFLSWQN